MTGLWIRLCPNSNRVNIVQCSIFVGKCLFKITVNWYLPTRKPEPYLGSYKHLWCRFFLSKYTFFYKQLESGISPQSCSYLQSSWCAKLINCCLVVWPSNLCKSSLICSFCYCLVREGWALKVAKQFAIRWLVAYKPVAYKKV